MILNKYKIDSEVYRFEEPDEKFFLKLETLLLELKCKGERASDKNDDNEMLLSLEAVMLQLRNHVVADFKSNLTKLENEEIGFDYQIWINESREHCSVITRLHPLGPGQKGNIYYGSEIIRQKHNQFLLTLG